MTPVESSNTISQLYDWISPTHTKSHDAKVFQILQHNPEYLKDRSLQEKIFIWLHKHNLVRLSKKVWFFVQKVDTVSASLHRGTLTESEMKQLSEADCQWMLTLASNCYLNHRLISIIKKLFPLLSFSSCPNKAIFQKSIFSSAGDIKALLQQDSQLIYAKNDFGSWPIHVAAAYGNKEVVKLFLAFDPKLKDAKDNRHYLPISYAITSENVRITQYFFKIDPQFDLAPYLHLATKQNKKNVIELLLSVNSQLKNAKDPRDNRPIHRAAAEGYKDIVELFVNFDPSLKDAKNNHGDFPIHWAAANGHKDIVELFVNFDPSLKDAKNNNGDLPIHWAAANGHKDIVELFVNFDPSLKDAKNNNGDLPIHWAAVNGRKDIVELFLTLDPLLKDAKNNNGDLPIHIAAANGRKDIVELFLTLDPSLKDAKNNNGDLPIHIAAANGRKDIVELFLTLDPLLKDAKNNHEDLPIHRAAANGRKDIVELFVNFDSPLKDAKNNHGNLPIHLAAANGHKDIVELFVNFDSSLKDAKNNDNALPILAAAQNGHKDIIELFLTLDSSLKDAKNNNGDLPIHWAAANGRKDIVELFLTLDPLLKDAKNNGNALPIHSAAYRNRKDIVTFLLWKEFGSPVHERSKALHIFSQNRPYIIEGYNSITQFLSTQSKHISSLEDITKIVHYLRWTQAVLLNPKGLDPQGLHCQYISPSDITPRLIRAIKLAIENLEKEINPVTSSTSGSSSSSSSSTPPVTDDELSSERIAEIRAQLKTYSSALIVINQYLNLDNRYGCTHKKHILKINTRREQITHILSQMSHRETIARKRTGRSEVDLDAEPWEFLIQLGLRTEKNFADLLEDNTPSTLMWNHGLETLQDYLNIGVYIPDIHDRAHLTEWLAKVESVAVMAENHAATLADLKTALSVSDSENIRAHTTTLQLELLKASLKKDHVDKIKAVFAETRTKRHRSS